MTNRWRWGFLICWLFCFAGRGLFARFTANDLTNLYFHLTPTFLQLLFRNLTFWSTECRPMGGLFYAAIYHLWGFHPLPFRIGCFLLMILNLILLYRVCARLAGSREVGMLAALLDAYHAWYVDIYYDSGTIYELLCFAFYVGAFDLYTSIRKDNRMPTGREWALLVALYIAALDSKELAVTFPVTLGLYELIWHSPRGWKSTWRWIAREGRAAMVTALITIPYVIGKLTGKGSLTENPLYRPEISFSRYFGTFRLYLNVVFYQEHFFRPYRAALLLVLMLAAALWLRSRPLRFAWFFVLFSVLPFVFVPHYSGFFIYLPMLGWTLFAADTLVILRKRLAGGMPDWAMFLAVAMLLVPLHIREARKTMAVFQSGQIPSTEAIDALKQARLKMPRGAHIFCTSDPFAAHEYALLFLMQEYYDDRTLEVRRAKDGALIGAERWDMVLTWRNGAWLEDERGQVQ
ncbi:MAG TPA: glycosyltransferase family 39 protein [Bryobacteraceae bacterium]|nr:glycosyltransferase family 39 protein [Bryobacteraceae bacterium]